MNTKTKRRLVVVTGVIIVVLAIVLAVMGSGGAAKSISVGDAVGGGYVGERVQVSGSVVDNSFETKEGVLTFDIYDPDGNPADTLRVRYDGAASSTFGNGVTAICTGKISDEGGLVLTASELVTKCPSKYESATDALSVSRLLDYGDSIVDTTVKLSGTVKAGTLAAAGAADARFVLLDSDGTEKEIAVEYDGALPDAVSDGTSVVATGALTAQGTFRATDVAQQA